MSDLLMKLLGRLSVVINAVANRLRGRTFSNPMTENLDRTGLCISSAYRADLLWSEQEVMFVDYQNSFPHSLWRSQEFSLFSQCKKYVNSPLLDYGCGDGSFSSFLFQSIDYGVDIDPDALVLAETHHIYDKLLSPIDDRIPLPDRSVMTIISNSVLEHTSNLESVVAELSRILHDNGTLLFTVPTDRFAAALSRYFGSAESLRINTSFYHRNLLGITDWTLLLHRHGFLDVKIRPYQPDWYTFLYRFIGTFLLGRLCGIANRKFPHMLKAIIVSLVSRSIDNTLAGNNLLIIARKGASGLHEQ